MTTSIHAADYFPKLHIHILRQYAKRWANQFSSVPICRIVLYRYSTNYQREYFNMQDRLEVPANNRKKHPTRYAIVFELVENTTSALEMWQEGHTRLRIEDVQALFNAIALNDLAEEEVYRASRLSCWESFFSYFCLMSNKQIQALLVYQSEAQPNGTLNLPFPLQILLSHEKLMTDYDRLVKATKIGDMGTFPYIYPELLVEGFDDVYKNETGKDNYEEEWDFFIMKPSSDMPPGIISEEPSIVLFDTMMTIKKASKFSNAQLKRYDRLNLTKLADSAELWCQRFNFLKAVILNRRTEYVSDGHGPEFELAFIVNGLFERWNSDLKGIFLNWLDHSLFIEGGVFSVLSGIYKNEKRTAKGILEEWFTPIIKPWETSLYYDILLAERVDTGNRSIEEIITFSDSYFLPGAALMTQSQSQKWQTKNAVWARRNGMLSAADLVCIMAYEERYISILPEIWNYFDLNIKGDICPDASKFETRVYIWVALFNRWVRHTVLDIDPSHKRNYKFKYVGRALEPHEQPDKSISIELDKLKSFFTQYEIPLPSQLFQGQCSEKLEIDKLIEDAHFEIERMVAYLKTGGWQRFKEAPETHFQNCAIDYFENKKFSQIKREYLNDKDLFIYRTGQERGDFIGKILVKIAMDRGIKKTNYQDMTKRYRKKYPAKKR